MPRYDFACRACSYIFEAQLPLGSTEIPACPHCKEQKVERLITPPLGIHFKGSGFYKTDSKHAPAKPTTQKAEVKKEETKADADAASKKETKESSENCPSTPHPAPLP